MRIIRLSLFLMVLLCAVTALSQTPAGVIIPDPSDTTHIPINRPSGPAVAQPLYLINGHESTGLSFLDPHDIASIAVYKDEQRIAIYGKKARNGVVDIRLKYEQDSLAPGREKPWLIADTMPRFQGGGTDAFVDWIKTELRYPKLAQREGIDGAVRVTFIIEKNGGLSNIRVLETPGKQLSREALRILRKSPKWTPGFREGQPVRIKYTGAVPFCIPGKNYNRILIR